MKRQSLKHSLLLLLTALIWGVAFVSQKAGMDYVGPFTFNGVRSILGGVVLLPAIPLLDRLRARGGETFRKGSRRDILVGGALCGVALFIGSGLQQMGIALQDPATNVGKAGFITACYTVIVPVLSLFFKKRSPLLVWIGVGIAILGFFSLSLMDGITAGQSLGLGVSDLLLLLCAVAFSVHILVIDHYSPLADGVRLSCVQFFVCGLLCLPFMLFWERPAVSDILACWFPIGYAGILSCGVAYTLQVVAQKGVHPTVASLLLSLESVFSVLAGYALMPGTSLSFWELFGCGLVFAAVLLVELAPSKEKI